MCMDYLTISIKWRKQACVMAALNTIDTDCIETICSFLTMREVYALHLACYGCSPPRDLFARRCRQLNINPGTEQPSRANCSLVSECESEPELNVQSLAYVINLSVMRTEARRVWPHWGYELQFAETVVLHTQSMPRQFNFVPPTLWSALRNNKIGILNPLVPRLIENMPGLWGTKPAAITTISTLLRRKYTDVAPLTISTLFRDRTAQALGVLYLTPHIAFTKYTWHAMSDWLRWDSDFNLMVIVIIACASTGAACMTTLMAAVRDVWMSTHEKYDASLLFSLLRDLREIRRLVLAGIDVNAIVELVVRHLHPAEDCDSSVMSFATDTFLRLYRAGAPSSNVLDIMATCTYNDEYNILHRGCTKWVANAEILVTMRPFGTPSEIAAAARYCDTALLQASESILRDSTLSTEGAIAIALLYSPEIYWPVNTTYCERVVSWFSRRQDAIRADFLSVGGR